MQEQDPVIVTIAGHTHDGFPVPGDMYLRLSWPHFIAWNGINDWSDLFSFAREYNTDHEHKRWYVWVLFLGCHFQFGWLWERLAAAAEAKEKGTK